MISLEKEIKHHDDVSSLVQKVLDVAFPDSGIEFVAGEAEILISLNGADRFEVLTVVSHIFGYKLNSVDFAYIERVREEIDTMQRGHEDDVYEHKRVCWVGANGFMHPTMTVFRYATEQQGGENDEIVSLTPPAYGVDVVGAVSFRPRHITIEKERSYEL